MSLAPETQRSFNMESTESTNLLSSQFYQLFHAIKQPPSHAFSTSSGAMEGLRTEAEARSWHWCPRPTGGEASLLCHFASERRHGAEAVFADMGLQRGSVPCPFKHLEASFQTINAYTDPYWHIGVLLFENFPK